MFFFLLCRHLLYVFSLEFHFESTFNAECDVEFSTMANKSAFMLMDLSEWASEEKKRIQNLYAYLSLWF